MLVNNIILKVRSRLRDTDFIRAGGTTFSDEEIIDSINESATSIVQALKINIKHFFSIISKDNPTLNLPLTPLALHEAKLDGQSIECTTHSQILSPRNALKEKTRILYKPSPRVYALYPKPTTKHTLEVFVSALTPVESAEDELELDSSFINCVVYGTLERLFQIETNESNLQRANYYAQKYRAELNAMRDLQNKSTEPNMWKTPCRFY